MQSTMSYVEAFFEFSTTFQSENQTNTSYYELSKSFRDTVKSHSGQLGYHERLYQKHWERIMLNHGSGNDMTMEVLVWTEYKKQVMVSSCEEFCS